MVNNYPFNPLTVGQANFNPYLSQVPMNPVIPNYQPVQQQGPRMQIESVNGKQSAYAYNIGPNSSVLLADAMNPKVWMITTDSSGFKIVKGFKIIPDDEDETSEPVQAVVEDSEVKKQMTDMTDRLEKLEKRLSEYEQSNNRINGQSKPDNGSVQSNDRNGQNSKGSNGSTKSNGNG